MEVEDRQYVKCMTKIGKGQEGEGKCTAEQTVIC